VLSLTLSMRVWRNRAYTTWISPAVGSSTRPDRAPWTRGYCGSTETPQTLRTLRQDSWRIEEIEPQAACKFVEHPRPAARTPPSGSLGDRPAVLPPQFLTVINSFWLHSRCAIHWCVETSLFLRCTNQQAVSQHYCEPQDLFEGCCQVEWWSGRGSNPRPSHCERF
jgi:hypothetical protein